MSELGSYENLYKYLNGIERNIISFTFKQLEDIIGFELPEVAHENVSFWQNRLDKYITNSGFSVSSIDLNTGCVMFVRN